MKIVLPGAALLGSALLVSCSLAPDYHVPDVPPIPVSFKEAGPWQLAHPADTVPRGSWWSVYGDPDLDRLEALVDGHNPTIAEAVAAYDVARADVAQAGSPLWPQIIAGGALTDNRQSDRRPLRGNGQPDEFHMNILDASINYDLDLWGRLRNGLAAQTAAAQASGADLATIQLSLHAELANDYTALRGLDAQEKLLSQSVEVYRRALAITQARYDGKIASGLDVARAQDQLETAQAAETEVLAQRALYEHAIASLIGESASAFSIAPRVVQIAVPHIPTGVPSTLLLRRPDIAAAERRVAAANAVVGIARAAFYPDISLSALVGFQNSGQAALISAPLSFWTIGPQMVFPLFEGGLRVAQEAAANASLRGAGEAYRAVVLTSFRQVEDGLSTLRILADELRQEQAAVASSQRAADMAMSLYRDGATNYLDVVVTQTAYLDAQRTALALQTRELQASVQLVRALGGGWSTNDLPDSSQVAEMNGPS
ncbi:MAG TPA: RND transporter [Acetobacteraceae bacterium]|jgi:NodT family efflux transporter outer membrane factor (OMF) lipoprotein|nr:RND transporter [Acetobacteraceae bacterium]